MGSVGVSPLPPSFTPTDVTYVKFLSSPKSKVPKSRPTELGLTLKSHGPPTPTPPSIKLLGIIEAVRKRDAEADEEHVRVGVGEGPEPVVLLLSGRVEQTEDVGLVTAK